MKLTSKKVIAALFVAMMLVAMLPWSAIADDGTQNDANQLYYSSTVSIEDIAILLLDIEDEDEDEGREPIGTITHFSITWLPDDTNAPESVTAVIIGSDQPQKVILEKAKGWSATVRLLPSTIPMSYLLMRVADFTVTAEEGSVEFTVTLPEEETPDVDATGEETPVDTAAERSIHIIANVTAEQELFYGDEITLTATLTGYDGLSYTLAWQCDKGDGWQAIAGKEGLTYTFALTEENLAWAYRLEATVAE